MYLEPRMKEIINSEHDIHENKDEYLLYEDREDEDIYSFYEDEDEEEYEDIY